MNHGFFASQPTRAIREKTGAVREKIEAKARKKPVPGLFSPPPPLPFDISQCHQASIPLHRSLVDCQLPAQRHAIGDVRFDRRFDVRYPRVSLLNTSARKSKHENDQTCDPQDIQI